MELSIRDAKARFTEAAAAAAAGERVVVTKHGRPFVQIVPVQPGGVDWDRVEAARQAIGLDGVHVELPPEFDDPAFSREVLGLSE